ncbi:MAG: hypothetical protein JSW07_15850, partial [bacterium]
PGFGTRILPGDSIRIALNWDSDGTATTGRGFFFDDVTLYGIGVLPYDIAALGAVGFQNAVVDKKLNLGVVVANTGLNSITGTLQWAGQISSIVGEDTTVVHPGMFGRLDVTDFGRDSVVVIPTNAFREWLVTKPGDYLFTGTASYAQDGDSENNNFAVVFTVFGPPFEKVIYREDFEPRGGQTSFEDFGFTVINDGGDALGNNENTWVYIEWIYGYNAELSGWYDFANLDEALDEYLISPVIDISNVGKHNTLYLRNYIYFRPGHTHPLLAAYGLQFTDITVEYSVDEGNTWEEVWYWADDDSVGGDALRWPQVPLGASAYDMTTFDISDAIGNETLQLRWHVTSENSYIFGIIVDELLVYEGIGCAKIMSVEDVPDDQGKQVRVSWRSSFNDLTLYDESGEEHFVTHYNLWRQIPEGAASTAMVVSDLKTMLSKPGKPGDSYIMGDMQYDFIATIPAHQDMYYNYVAPTLWDGVETYFMVSAHTEDPMVFADSEPMAGTSVDNLAPSAPMNVMAMGQNNTNVLTWEASPEEDV